MANLHKLMALVPIACMVITSQATSHVTMPLSDYGTLRSKTNFTSPAKVKSFTSKENQNGYMKVSAFANEGNAEVDKFGELILVEQEDFSLLSTGSEENPDLSTELEIPRWIEDENGDYIDNPEYEYPWNNMKPEYIQGDHGWGIGNAYPAGGMLYFPFSQDAPQGKISTPWLDLSAYQGTFVLEFKVKITDEAQSNPQMPTMIIVETAETNNMSPSWDFYEDSFVNYENLSTEWTTFRLLYQGAGQSTLCNIVGQGLSGGMFIDDIKIYSLKPFLSAPELRRHTEFTESSFVANWKPVENAEKYIVNVWYDNLYGNRKFLAENIETTETSYKVEGTDLYETYFYTVQAINSEHRSLEPKAKEVFDIVAPKMRKAVPVEGEENFYEGGVEEVASAYGYNYFALAKRTAEEDGPFTVTHETFTGWRHPVYEDGEEYTKENPADDKIASLYFPSDIKQQGWYGENFQIYKDYICLVPFFYEASLHQEQTAWVSPEFDLSKDGGKITVSMNLAAQYDITFQNYAKCIVGLFNWNEEKGDYEQAEIIYCSDLNFDWQSRTVEFSKGTARSKIAFFGVGSYGDLYIDDIIISQNYKQGDTFFDPFYFSTWQLADQMWDITSFEFEVPEFILGSDIYQKAQAVRTHFDEQGYYDGEVSSPFSEIDFIDNTSSGVKLVTNNLIGYINVSDGIINIENPDADNVSVYTTDGKNIVLGNATSISFRPDSKGVYIVTIGNRNIKLAL